jgi:hypothetical protein
MFDCQTGSGTAKPYSFAFCLFLIAAPSFAETIDVFDNHGGLVAQYQAQWSELAARHVSVRVVGPCQSACTVLIGHIPRKQICVTPQASFGFHLATAPSATADLWQTYPADIRNWITQHGGLTYNLM